MNIHEDRNAVFQMRFPQKLWYLLNLRTDAILWGGTGRTILLNYKVLHKYLQCDSSIFKTTNISSFVRQLNLYGFRKVTSHLQDPLCNSSNPYLHEYIHDFFQFGRPELLNKMNRKALTGKKCFKPLAFYSATQNTYSTPLQKARLAFRMTLKKTAYELYNIQASPPEHSLHSEHQSIDDGEDLDFCDEEEPASSDWLKNKQADTTPDPIPETNENTQLFTTALDVEIIKDEKVIKIDCEAENYGDMNLDDNFMNFQETQQSDQSEQFPGQILNMPDLQQQTDHGVELLAEFDINHDIDEGIIKKIDGRYNSNDSNSLNCVLPSVNDQFDDVVIAERTGYSSYYNTEWDQMFNEMMATKNSSLEGSSDMREIYSQISRTIDLLNS